MKKTNAVSKRSRNSFAGVGTATARGLRSVSSAMRAKPRIRPRLSTHHDGSAARGVGSPSRRSESSGGPDGFATSTQISFLPGRSHGVRSTRVSIRQAVSSLMPGLSAFPFTHSLYRRIARSVPCTGPFEAGRSKRPLNVSTGISASPHCRRIAFTGLGAISQGASEVCRMKEISEENEQRNTRKPRGRTARAAVPIHWARRQLIGTPMPPA